MKDLSTNVAHLVKDFLTRQLIIYLLWLQVWFLASVHLNFPSEVLEQVLLLDLVHIFLLPIIIDSLLCGLLLLESVFLSPPVKLLFLFFKFLLLRSKLNVFFCL